MNGEELDTKWYVMRTLASNSYKTVRAHLEAEKIDFFQPCRCVVRKFAGRSTKVMEPYVPNLFFVHSSYQRLHPFTEEGSRFQFYFNRCSGIQADCLVVKDKQMEDFIRVSSCLDADPRFFYPDEGNSLSKGQKVRIISGPLDGVEGVFERVEGSKRKRLVIVIESLMGVSARVESDMIELLK